MGMLFTKLWDLLGGKKEYRILILGLDNAGKTTILNKLHSPDKVIRTMPTIGFNMEYVVYKNIKFQVWDLGGQTSIRPFWRCYYPRTSAIIYVVDSADHDRLGISKKELLQMLEEEELKNVTICVLANKQDLKQAFTPAQVSEGLGLSAIKDRQWQLFKTCAITGDGLTQALDWLGDVLAQQ